MFNIIGEGFAAKTMIVLFCLIILFHLLVITHVIPMNIVWGGRLSGGPEFYRFETVSILSNLFMLFVVLSRTGVFKKWVNQKFITIMLWLMFALFVLNTIGNLLAVNKIEMAVFTPLTILLAILSLRLALRTRETT